MTTYIVTEKSTGREVYRYSADAPIEWGGFEFATHDHVAEIAQPAEPIPEALPMIWSPFVFLRRFTQQERTRALDAAKADVNMQDFWMLLQMAPEIHSDDPDVILGLDYMVYVGVVTEARAWEILNG